MSQKNRPKWLGKAAADCIGWLADWFGRFVLAGGWRRARRSFLSPMCAFTSSASPATASIKQRAVCIGSMTGLTDASWSGVGLKSTSINWVRARLIAISRPTTKISSRCWGGAWFQTTAESRRILLACCAPVRRNPGGMHAHIDRNRSTAHRSPARRPTPCGPSGRLRSLSLQLPPPAVVGYVGRQRIELEVDCVRAIWGILLIAKASQRAQAQA